MTDFDFSDFDALLNKDALKEIENASKQTFNNDPLPENTYNMSVESLGFTTTKNGNPAVKCDFKVKDGEYAGRHMFYWLNLTTSDGKKIHPFKVHMCHVFLNSLTGDQIKCDVKDGFEKFAKEIEQVFEFAKNGYYEMKLTYNHPKKADGTPNMEMSFPNLEPVNFYQYE